MIQKRLTKAGLARVLGCSRPAVIRHLAKPDAPEPDSAGRYDVGTVRRFILHARERDNRYPSAELMRAKIDKLRLECRSLRQRTKADMPAIPIADLEPLLWDMINEINKTIMVQMVNGIGPWLSQWSDPGQVRKIQMEAVARVEGHLCDWLAERSIKIGPHVVPFPVEEHPSLLCIYRRRPSHPIPVHTPTPGENTQPEEQEAENEDHT